MILPGAGACGLPEWLCPLAEAVHRAGAEEFGPRLRPPAGGGRASAVLVLLAEGSRGPDVLLIERAADLRSHAGQPAFPGGAVERGDGSEVVAALREAAEETALDPATVEVFGTLPDLWIDRTGFRVTPVLAWWREPCEVRPADTGEVAAVARVPLRDLAEPANRTRLRYPGGHVGPAFRVAGMLVWGFTAGLLDWLLRSGGWEQPWRCGDGTGVEDLPR